MCDDRLAFVIIGTGLEVVGLLVLVFDTLLRLRRTEKAMTASTHRQGSAHVEGGGDVTARGEAKHGGTPPGYPGPPPPANTLEEMAAWQETLGALNSSTQADMTRLDRRLRELVNTRFDRALNEARQQADTIRRELHEDLRRTAWRPLLSTGLVMLGIAASTVANVCSA